MKDYSGVKSSQTMAALSGIFTQSKQARKHFRGAIGWSSPKELVEKLNEEFHFDFDPCPLDPDPKENGVFMDWGKRNFVNPPYNQAISGWLQKGVMEKEKGNLSVFLLPSRTDVKWFHDLVLPHADEIRFVRGRLRFGNGKAPAPFPSIIVIFQPEIEMTSNNNNTEAAGK